MNPRWTRASRGLLALLISLTLLTVPFARPLAEGLRESGLLLPAVLVLSGLALALLVALVPGRDRLALLLLLPGWFFFSRAFVLPEERVHLAQYLVLGALAGRVLPLRWAVAGLVLLPWFDEGLQALVPDRRWDTTDVLADLLAAASGLLIRQDRPSLRWVAGAPMFAGALLVPWLRATPPPPGTWPPDRPHPAPAGDIDRTAPYAGAPVVLITIDALRRDHVPPWGGSGVPLPAFERLASESIHAEDPLANSLWTSPSCVTLLSGLHPAVHGVLSRGLESQPGITLPLETLAALGWTLRGHAGDDEETYRNLGFHHSVDRDRPPMDHLSEAAILPRAFLWLHLRDVHAPYDATPESLRALGLPDRLPEATILARARTSATVPRRDFPGSHAWLRPVIDALYSKEVHDADASLGTLLEAMDRTGLARRAILVVTADHGEELLERDGIGHASTTLDALPQPELVRIPLWIRLPDGQGAGKTLPGPWEQADLMPTLLPLLGVRAQTVMDGTDRSPCIRALLADTPLPEEPDRAVVVASSPCGWQCPPGRRSERVWAWIQGDEWVICRHGARCDPRIEAAISRFAARAAALRSPVASPR